MLWTTVGCGGSLRRFLLALSCTLAAEWSNERVFTSNITAELMARPTSPKTLVSRIFSGSQRPLYLLDASGRIVFCNAALSEWLGLGEDQLVGLKCKYVANATDNSPASRLAVPPHARGQLCFHGRITVGDEAQICRQAIFVTLQDSLDIGSTLVVVDGSDSIVGEESHFDVESLHRQLLFLRHEWSQPYTLENLAGQSLPIRQARARVDAAIASGCRIVISGNEGTGRESTARLIHRECTQATERLVPLDCSFTDVELLRGFLQDFVRLATEFGNDNPGTLLLLDVDRLSIEAQAVLLEYVSLEEPKFRTIATCITPLSTLVAESGFLPSLAQSLCHLDIHLPSLTDRLDDIPLLAQWVLEQSAHAERLGGFTAEAIEALLRYTWPREFEELKELVVESAEHANGDLIGKEDLPKKCAYAADALALPDVKQEDIDLDEFMAEVETELIGRALRHAKGNRAQAARALGVSRGKLLRRIEQLGIGDP